ncbi:chromate transporter [Caloranaerobacter azorensis DSM 13643]|uniref:Chromate transporter n=1 Tax=Caloranaerobacter azorensis DSM 13643 TaxID=1121264 RepID=A0A1M5SJB5_9FIRM|nr:chromate transporter [Caloranaerobacter azorensis]SHH38581.1 chromate transporter [Caloranaerobacter azorensis DSM 13643]
MIYIKLFISFLKIGVFSFGGGYAMLPLIQEEVITKNGWINLKEFVDILAISQMTPGPIAINSATFLGYKIGGVLGAVVSTLAVITPSLVIILLIAHFLRKFKESKYVDWFFKGLRPIIIGLIASAAILVAKNTIIDIKSLIITLAIFYLVTYKKLHPILCIVIAGGLGVIMY